MSVVVDVGSFFVEDAATNACQTGLLTFGTVALLSLLSSVFSGGV